MNDVQCAFRFPADLVERLDLYAAKLSKDGLHVTRADAVRVLCVLGLEQARIPGVPPKKRKAKRKRAAK